MGEAPLHTEETSKRTDDARGNSEYDVLEVTWAMRGKSTMIKATIRGGKCQVRYSPISDLNLSLRSQSIDLLELNSSFLFH